MIKLKEDDKLVGAKQVKRVLITEEGASSINRIFISQDADLEVTSDIVDLGKARGIEIVYVQTMEELGEACGIEVKAAVAALLNKNDE